MLQFGGETTTTSFMMQSGYTEPTMYVDNHHIGSKGDLYHYQTQCNLLLGRVRLPYRYSSVSLGRLRWVVNGPPSVKDNSGLDHSTHAIMRGLYAYWRLRRHSRVPFSYSSVSFRFRFLSCLVGSLSPSPVCSIARFSHLSSFWFSFRQIDHHSFVWQSSK